MDSEFKKKQNKNIERVHYLFIYSFDWNVKNAQHLVI